MARLSGKCNCCRKRMGGYTANGTFRWDPKVMAQVAIIFAYPGTDKTTQIHVPICKGCSEDFNFDDLDTDLQQREIEYKKFRLGNPTATYSSYKLDKLPWDN